MTASSPIWSHQALLRQALDLAHACGGHARVAELAAAGMTSRASAQALYLTAQTVEHHLTSTYGKLNIETRAQLPVALAEAHHQRTRRPQHGGTAGSTNGVPFNDPDVAPSL